MSTPSWQLVIFDLDGTLVQSQEAIIPTIQATLAACGITETNQELLRSFIGPSLTDTYGGHYGLTGHRLQQAIEQHERIFQQQGIDQIPLFPGVAELLTTLKKRDYRLAIATTKSVAVAKRVLKNCQIDFFDYVGGAAETETRSHKGHLIKEVLEQFPTVPASHAILVGDRHFDIEAATANQIDSIAVTYGYGSLEELEAVHPTFMVNTPTEIGQILDRQK